MSSCLSTESVERFVAGELSTAAAASVDEHIADCDSCRACVLEVARASVIAQRSAAAQPTPQSDATASTWLAAQPATAPNGVVAADLPEGTRVGRYVLVGTLGRGGMGVVYLAFDSVLHREVALKFVRAELAGAMGDSARELLIAEGRALAKVSHPNVVAIYDVGMHAEGVFVATEYIDAGTLRDHRMHRDADVAEILRAYIEAAQGLAAVHAAGIVHRDFKPANVLVSCSGTVKVTDFGLASLRKHAGEAEATAGAEGTVGTPAYMAPEQFDGEEVGPAADQWAFAVSLYEALTGKRPYGGKNVLALSLACRDPQLAFGRDVPRVVAAAIRRALNVDPLARFRDMDAVLVELRRALVSPWKRLAIPGAAVLAAGTVAVVLVGAREAPCEAIGAPVDVVWGTAARSRAEAGLDGAPAASTERLLDVLDGYAKTLRAARLAACRAAEVEDRRSDALYDLQLHCLDGRIASLHTVTEAAASDAVDVDVALEAAIGLPPVSACEDEEHLLAVVPLPDDPVERAEIGALNATVSEAMIVDDLGDRSRARAMLDEARQVLGDRYAPLAATLACTQGEMELNDSDFGAAEEALERCATQAAAAGDDERLAQAWIALFGLEGFYRARYDEALSRTGMISTALQRAGDPPVITGRFHQVRGLVLQNAGRFEEAEQDFHTAIEKFEEGGNLDGVATTYNTLGGLAWDRKRDDDALRFLEEGLRRNAELYGPAHARVLTSKMNVIGAMKGDPEEALRRKREVLAEIETHLGPQHRLGAILWLNIGRTLMELYREEEALAAFDEALRIRTALHGEQHAEVAKIYKSKAGALGDLGRSKEAIATLEHARKIQRDVLPAGHRDLLASALALAQEHRGLGDLERALELTREAVKTAEHPPVVPLDLASALTGAGYLALELDRADDACTAFGRAVSQVEAALGKESPALARSLMGMAACSAALGHFEKAAAAGERGLAVHMPVADEQPQRTCEYLLHVAKILWKHPPLRPRASELEHQLVERIATAQHTNAVEADLREWRATR